MAASRAGATIPSTHVVAGTVDVSPGCRGGAGRGPAHVRRRQDRRAARGICDGGRTRRRVRRMDRQARGHRARPRARGQSNLLPTVSRSPSFRARSIRMSRCRCVSRRPAAARTAGLVWKYQDRLNHYSAQLDLAKQELAVYRVVNGNRIRLEREDDLELDPDAWHSLKIFQERGEIRVYLGGIRVFSERDRLPRTPRQRRALDRRRLHRHVRRLPHRRRNRGCARPPLPRSRNNESARRRG